MLHMKISVCDMCVSHKGCINLHHSVYIHMSHVPATHSERRMVSLCTC